MFNYELKIYSTDNDIVGKNSDNRLTVLKNEMLRLETIGREGIIQENGLNEDIIPACLILYDNKRNCIIDRIFI
jgi:hypothetical protein